VKSWFDPLLRHFAVIVALVVVFGCDRTTPTQPPITAKSKPVATAEEKMPANESTETSDKEKIDEPLRPERILFLTPGGPVVADVFLSIEGQPHDQALQEIVQRVLAAGDTDHDGRSTWQEWKENEAFFQEALAEDSMMTPRQINQWIKRYDENRDKRMQPAEAAAWLGRNGGGSARAFAVRSRRSFVAHLTSSSRVWQLLDKDRNGALSETEIGHTPERFWSLDANDDRTITPVELASLRDQLEKAGGRPFRANRSSRRYAAIHCDSSLDLDSLDSLLSDLYAPRQSLGPQSFSDLPDLFAKLDVDQNKKIERGELAAIFHIQPMLKLSIAFHASDDAPATVSVDGHVDEISLGAQKSDHRVVFSLGKTRLMISAHDLASGEERGLAIPRSQLRLMVHDQCDAMFQELDSNGNGRLGEREIESSGERLLQYDANNDRQVTSDELPYPMIVAFLRGEPSKQRSFYVPDANVATSDAEASPSWFKQADFNGDGDISRREFMGSSERFSKIDLDDDGYINREEAAAYEGN